MYRSTRLQLIIFVSLLSLPDMAVLARQDEPRISSDQLDALVAPIALYPDPLLSQVLVASTYPLEVIQLHQWLTKNASGLDQNVMATAIQQLDLDPSIQAMAVLPEVLKDMADHPGWTHDLGNAFLAQQNDVMNAIQRMRVKARDNGNLKSSEQMNVDTRLVESKTAVVIEQTNPDVIYVPSYNPEAVWGVIVYAYPPFYYPPLGYYGVGVVIGFRDGVAVGMAWGGGWGWRCGWATNDISINRNNNFVRNSSIRNPANSIESNAWQHNAQHRGGAPYSNKSVAARYGSTALGDASRGSLGGPMHAAGAGERIGSRDVSGGPGAGNRGSWGAPSSFGGSAMSGSGVRSSSMRGATSIGGSVSGGMRGSGASRAGGRRS